MDIEKSKCYIVELVITFIGILGISGTLISGAGLDDALWVVAIVGAMVVSVLYTYIMEYKKPSKRCVAAIVAGSLVTVLIFAKMLFRGVCRIIVQSAEKLGEQNKSEINLPDIIMDNASPSMTWVVVVFTVLIFGFFVALNVSKVRSMLFAVVTILPIMMIYIFFLIIPNIFSMVCCVVYVFAVSGLRKKTYGYTNALNLIALTSVVSIAVLLIFYQNYQRPEFFVKTGNHLNNIYSYYIWELRGTKFPYGNGYGNGNSSEVADDINNQVYSYGGYTNSGELGKASEVDGSKELLYNLYTRDIGKNQYIRTFVGTDYKRISNKWDRKYGNNQATDDAALDIALMAESNEGLRDYIDGGTGKYNEMRYAYAYRLDPVNGDSKIHIAQFVSKYELKENLYDRFADITGNKQNDVLAAMGSDEDSRKFISDTDAYNSQVYKNYLFVDAKSRELIEGFMGVKNITSTQDKLDYIDTVKDFLAENYTYTRTPGKVPDKTDFVTYFLTESKKGYCTYFATSAVLMFRSAGIPARYVEGYLVTESEIKSSASINMPDYFGSEKQEYSDQIEAKIVDVDSSMAHAWVEVYMYGFGWIDVEVTPPMQSGISNQEWENESLYQEESRSADSTESTLDEAASSADDEQTTVSDEQGIFDNNGGTTSNRRLVVLFYAALIFIIAGAVSLMYGHRRRKQRYIDNLFKNGSILQIYMYLEKCLDKKGYVRPSYMDYESFGTYLENENEIFKNNHIGLIIEEALRERFAGCNDNDETVDYKVCDDMRSIELLRVYARNIRDFLIKNEEHNV